MCGISGILSFEDRIEPRHIIEMTDIIDYRGPDDYGYIGMNTNSSRKNPVPFKGENEIGANADFNFYFGHRRLAILDLSPAGHQPMSYHKGDYWIVYNGEIYNYLELREQLKQKGYKFYTQTDTEVILASYQEWGMDCLHKFNGMWAFALMDTRKMELFFARDRLGIKPFYYYFDWKYVAFASEIKQLLSLPFVEKKFHQGTLFDFLVMGQYGTTSQYTFYQDIYELRGGHYLKVNLKGENRGSQPEPGKWWDLDLRRKISAHNDEKTYAETFFQIFDDAVKLRLRSDVPVGSCLSGGLDSSGIVCVADKYFKDNKISGRQKTFTAVSDHKEFDEREYAEAVIEATNVKPYFILPTPEKLISDLDKLIWHQDEPFSGTSIFAGWCVYQLAKENGVTVTLDGQGPDEIFGGYNGAYKPLLAENLVKFQFIEFWKNVKTQKEKLRLSIKRILRDVLSQVFYSKGLVPVNYMGSLRRAKPLFTSEFIEEGLKKSPVVQRMKGLKIQDKETGGGPFDRYLLTMTKFGSLPGILRQVDRNSMAFSLEARLPFLDHRVVEFIFSLPTRWKIQNGVTKFLYRQALKGTMPETIRTRKSKLGFVTAEPIWLKGKLKKTFLQTFEQIPAEAPYKKETLVKCFNEMTNDCRPFNLIYWKIFNVERLKNYFINSY